MPLTQEAIGKAVYVQCVPLLILLFNSGLAASLQRLCHYRGVRLQENCQPKLISGPWKSFPQHYSSAISSAFSESHRVIVTPPLTRNYFSLKSSPDQLEAFHKISAQQVQPFQKQTFYFYSIALYIYYYKNRFLRISDKPMNLENLQPKTILGPIGSFTQNFSSIG